MSNHTTAAGQQSLSCKLYLIRTKSCTLIALAYPLLDHFDNFTPPCLRNVIASNYTVWIHYVDAKDLFFIMAAHNAMLPDITDEWGGYKALQPAPCSMTAQALTQLQLGIAPLEQSSMKPRVYPPCSPTKLSSTSSVIQST